MDILWEVCLVAALIVGCFMLLLIVIEALKWLEQFRIERFCRQNQRSISESES